MVRNTSRTFAIVLFLFINTYLGFSSDIKSKWYYKCVDGYCLKTLLTANTTSPLSQAECNILCLDSAGVWPKPTGHIEVANLTAVNISKFTYTAPQNVPISKSVASVFYIFIDQVKELLPSSGHSKFPSLESKASSVQLNIKVSDKSTTTLGLKTNENYTISSSASTKSGIVITIEAETFFGARHALETLSQLVVYDDLRNRIIFPSTVSVVDGPVYPWRGIVLDTARNFVTPQVIKRTLKAMGASKLNTFHWHITDSSSFPYVSKSHPELAAYGAYSSSKVYTDDIVRDLIEYGRLRGIRIVPELDAPAHVGEGWQESGVTTCFNWKPWTEYCGEPPCGQFDPSKDKLYDILEDIYGDMLEQFGAEVFHMGGDEVCLACWNATEDLTSWMVQKGWGLTANDFYYKLWNYFQTEASKRLYKKAGKEIPIIIWTSDLTASNNVENILPPSKYIIQIWTKADDESIQTLLNKNYSLILSNNDAVYLDCGFSGWVSSGNNWCSPYKGWQLAYENKPKNIAGNKKNQILGGEAALWTEQAGSNSVDSRLWPRAAAFAETLWTEPETSWEAAEERMLIHRDRLASMGIDADHLEPEWCLQNQQNCPSNGRFNN